MLYNVFMYLYWFLYVDLCFMMFQYVSLCFQLFLSGLIFWNENISTYTHILYINIYYDIYLEIFIYSLKVI
jgi:hypothetical protein